MFQLLLVGLVAAGPLAPPTLQPGWSFIAEGPLLSPITAADMHSAHGTETAIVDNGTGSVILVSARGEILWSYDGAFKQRGAGPPAFTPATSDTPPRLALADDAGAIVILNTEDGSDFLRIEEEPAPGAAVAWVDLDDDQAFELLVVSKGRVDCLASDGSLLWQNRGEDLGRDLALIPAVAAGDVNEDRYAEIFLADRWGILCLDNNGFLLWQKPNPAGITAAPIAARFTDDGPFALVTATHSPPSVLAIDATSGDNLWSAPLDAPIDGSSGLAFEDLESVDSLEVIASDSAGRLYAIDSHGKIAWTFTSEHKAPAAITCGDLDGDGFAEIIASCADASLNVLNAAGALQHRLENTSLQAVPLVDLLDGGIISLLLCTPNRTLQAVSLPHSSAPELLTWPSPRQNAAQTAFHASSEALEQLNWIESETQLLQNPGFEWSAPTAATADAMPADVAELLSQDQAPRAWNATAGSVRWEGGGIEGNAAAHAIPNDFAQVVSHAINLPFATRLTSASVMGKGEDISAAVVFLAGERQCGRQDLEAAEPGADGWRELKLDAAPVPVGATRVQLELNSIGEAWWDKASLAAHTRALPQAGVLVNQIGYEIAAPKAFLVWANYIAGAATFELIDSGGAVAHSASLPTPQRMTGSYGGDWGAWFYRGDFTPVNVAGQYRLRISVDDALVMEQSIEIGEDLLWLRLRDVLVSCIQQHRCGTELVGDCAGDHNSGWQDGSWASRSDTVGITYDLLTSFGITRWRYLDAEGKLAQPVPMLEEGLYGAETVQHELDALVSASTPWGQLAPNAAVLARAARYAPEERQEEFFTAASQLLDELVAQGVTGPELFNAAIDLFLTRKEDRHKQLAMQLRPEMGDESVDAYVAYESEIDYTASYTFKLAMKLEGAGKTIAQRAANVFGLLPMGESTDDYFATPGLSLPMPRGNSETILRAAESVARAYRFVPHPELASFIYDQINWLCGVNPFGICLIEGVAPSSPPAWYRPETVARLQRGAVAGAVAAGISAAGVGDDAPIFDLRPIQSPESRTNSHYLRDSVRLLHVLARLKQIPL